MLKNESNCIIYKFSKKIIYDVVSIRVRTTSTMTHPHTCTYPHTNESYYTAILVIKPTFCGPKVGFIKRVDGII